MGENRKTVLKLVYIAETGKNKARNSRIANGHCANCGEKHDER